MRYLVLGTLILTGTPSLGQPGLYYVPDSQYSQVQPYSHFLSLAADGSAVYGRGLSGTWGWNPGDGRYALPATDFVARTVSDNGQVLAGDDFVEHVPGQDIVDAMIRLQDGSQFPLGQQGLWEQRVAAMNPTGDVVYGVTRVTSTHSLSDTWRWSSSTGMVSIPNFGSVAADCSSDGSIVVGNSEFGQWTGRIWQDGVATNLAGLSTSASRTWVSAMNSSGSLIAGYGYRDQNPAQTAAIWENGVPTALPTPEGYTSTAFDLSDDGSVIIGGVYRSGSQYAVVWTPGVGMAAATDYFAQFGITLPTSEPHWLEKVSSDGTVFAGRRQLQTGLYDNFVIVTPAPGSLALLALMAVIGPRRRTR